MNHVFIATCKNWNGEKTHDSNKNRNVALLPFAGSAPRGVNVIAGTVAISEGFEAGKCYAVKATETEPYTNPDTGKTSKSFNFDMIAELPALEAYKEAQSGGVLTLEIAPGSEKEAVAETAKKPLAVKE